MRYLGLDVGKKRIGVAVSDSLGMTATPLTLIKCSSLNKDIEQIVALAIENEATEIVVGMPINMDGTEGPAAGHVKKLIAKIAEKTDLPIVTWDERLSTTAVTRVLIEADTSRAKRREVVDKLSAAYILQGYLDSPKNSGLQA